MEVRRPCVRVIALFASIALGACSGSIMEPGGPGETPAPKSGGKGGTSTSKPPRADTPVAPGETPEAKLCDELRNAKRTAVVAAMRRLSWQEIVNSLTDLFPQTSATDFAMFTDPTESPTRARVALDPNESFVRAYRPALATFAGRAAQATADGACKGAPASCLETQLVSVARRAWRSSLTTEDRARLVTKLTAFTGEIGPAPGYAAALELVLASPRFLFLSDPGSFEGDASKDGAFEAKGDRLAGLWAAAVWGSVPDEALLDAAASGALDAADKRTAELDRMLSDARARRGMTGFFRAWLAYNQILKSIKDEKLYPTFDDVVRGEMLTDTEKTLLQLVFDDKQSPAALLRSPMGHPGAKTIALLDWGKSSVAPKPGDLTAVNRSGIATHPAVLSITAKSDSTSIVNRGRFVVEKLACGHVPDPPDDVDLDLDKLAAEAGGRITGRQLAERHAREPACAGCHKFMDPFGMVFESYDAVGRHRTMEDNGLPIDTSVQINDAIGVTGKFDGARPLLEAVAKTGRGDTCFATNFAQFVMPAELTEAQACAITDLAVGKDGKPATMLDVARGFLLSSTFLTRSAAVN